MGEKEYCLQKSLVSWLFNKMGLSSGSRSRGTNDFSRRVGVSVAVSMHVIQDRPSPAPHPFCRHVNILLPLPVRVKPPIPSKSCDPISVCEVKSSTWSSGAHCPSV